MSGTYGPTRRPETRRVVDRDATHEVGHHERSPTALPAESGVDTTECGGGVTAATVGGDR